MISRLLFVHPMVEEILWCKSAPGRLRLSLKELGVHDVVPRYIGSTRFSRSHIDLTLSLWGLLEKHLLVSL